MINTKNIILIASITAVLGFASVALQTNTITVDALMDNASEILDIGEKSEITTLAPPPGKGKNKSSALEGEGISSDGQTTIKCSASNILKCTIKNSDLGIKRATLLANDIDGYQWPCEIKIVKEGASRATVSTRSNDNPTYCNYPSLFNYKVDVTLVNTSSLACFTVSTDTNSLKIVLCSNNA